MHSPQQYSYIYFPELPSLQTLKTLISHLQHFTPVYMHSPTASTHTYFPELPSLPTLKPHHTYNILPSVYAFPTAVLIHTFLNWQAFQHLNLITLTTFYPVYTHSPQHYSMAGLQHYEHFQTL